MQNFERTIGPVHNLVVFEAAARHLSFSRAAVELSVTQPAVSQSVRRLEQTLAVQLFHRTHRSIALTPAGEQLFAEVSDSFGRILSTARRIARAARPDHVTVLASTAFATWWLVPRMARFHAASPGVDLRIETVDKDIDISAPATTLAVRRGDGLWPGCAATEVAPEVLVAMASPAFLARHGLVGRIEDLPGLPLIHLDEPFRYRPGWKAFLAHFGVAWRDKGEGLRLNDYALVLQAAMAGEGLALGWMHVCARPMAQGLLQVAGPWAYRTGEGFHLIWSDTAALSRDAVLFRDWMIDEVEIAAAEMPVLQSKMTRCNPDFSS